MDDLPPFRAHDQIMLDGRYPEIIRQLVAAIDGLIERIKASGLAPDEKEEATRNLTNVKEEVTENETPDKGRIARWLGRAQQITKLGTAGAELIEKGEELYRQFGGGS